jgi:hypothetical protein
MQQTIQHPNYQGGEQSTHTAARADTCIGNRCVTGTTVLVIAGISTGIVSRELAYAAALGQAAVFTTGEPSARRCAQQKPVDAVAYRGRYGINAPMTCCLLSSRITSARLLCVGQQ